MSYYCTKAGRFPIFLPACRTLRIANCVSAPPENSGEPVLRVEAHLWDVAGCSVDFDIES